jgi:hypothetical protein
MTDFVCKGAAWQLGTTARLRRAATADPLGLLDALVRACMQSGALCLPRADGIGATPDIIAWTCDVPADLGSGRVLVKLFNVSTPPLADAFDAEIAAHRRLAGLDAFRDTDLRYTLPHLHVSGRDLRGRYTRQAHDALGFAVYDAVDGVALADVAAAAVDADLCLAWLYTACRLVELWASQGIVAYDVNAATWTVRRDATTAALTPVLATTNLRTQGTVRRCTSQLLEDVAQRFQGRAVPSQMLQMKVAYDSGLLGCDVRLDTAAVADAVGHVAQPLLLASSPPSSLLATAMERCRTAGADVASVLSFLEANGQHAACIDARTAVHADGDDAVVSDATGSGASFTDTHRI